MRIRNAQQHTDPTDPDPDADPTDPNRDPEFTDPYLDAYPDPITASRYVITILKHYFLTKFWPKNSTQFQILYGPYNRSDTVCTFLLLSWL
jgi:hypothetical protein